MSVEFPHIYSHVTAPRCHCLKTWMMNECSLTWKDDEAPGLLTRNRRGRSLCRSKVGTWARGCCIRTPRSQSRPSRIPSGIAGNSIFPGQGRSHLKELRGERSLIAALTIHQRRELLQGCSRQHSYNACRNEADILGVCALAAKSIHLLSPCSTSA